MSRLDRYVGRIAAGAFGAGLLFFTFLMVVLDLLGNITRYVNHASKQGLSGMDFALFLAEYYAKFLPVLVTMVAPFVTVIAGMLTVARLQGANEVVPMLCTGRSTRRVLRPVLTMGVLAALGMGACWQWIVPQVGGSLMEANLVLNEGRSSQRNLVLETGDAVRTVLFAREYVPTERTMQGVAMLRLDERRQEPPTLVRAERASFDAQRGDWQLERGVEITPAGERDLAWLGRPDLTPQVLLQRGREQVDPESQSYSELLETIAARPNRVGVRMALHRHLAAPLANVILLLLALPFAVSFERQSRTGRLLVAIGLCAGFTLANLACQSFGEHGFVHPVVAAWLPTVVFGALGVALWGGLRT
jgi:lipopolysaccharide export LptBFGC system permease protein LptF